MMSQRHPYIQPLHTFVLDRKFDVPLKTTSVSSAFKRISENAPIMDDLVLLENHENLLTYKTSTDLLPMILKHILRSGVDTHRFGAPQLRKLSEVLENIYHRN